MRRLFYLAFALAMALSAFSSVKAPIEQPSHVKNSYGELNDEFYSEYARQMELQQGEDNEIESALFELINEYRVDNGLNELEWNDTVADVARLRAAYLLNNPPTRHQIDSLGGNFTGTLKNYGSEYGGGHVENLAQRASSYGKPITADMLFEQWKDSELHNANLLNPDVTCGGIGAVKTGNAFNKGYSGLFAAFCAVK